MTSNIQNPTSPASTLSQEEIVGALPGALILLLLLLALAGDGYLLSLTPSGPSVALIPIVFVAILVCLNGFFTLQPNEARVLILFGRYKGTVRKSGFYWINPFYSKGGAFRPWARQRQRLLRR